MRWSSSKKSGETEVDRPKKKKGTTNKTTARTSVLKSVGQGKVAHKLEAGDDGKSVLLLFVLVQFAIEVSRFKGKTNIYPSYL